MAANEAAKFYIDDVLLPITPAQITIKNANKNISTQLVDGRPATIPQLDGAQQVTFDFIIPNQKETCAFNEELKGIRFYTDLVWYIKQKRQPVVLTITRANGVYTNIVAMLDDYSYVEDAEHNSDYYFSVSFTEWAEWRNQEINSDINGKLEAAKSARNWKGV